MTSDVVTLDQVKAHLRLEGTTEHDDNLLMKIEEATALCEEFIKNYSGTTEERAARYAVIEAWTEQDNPLEFYQMRAAVLRMVGHLFRFAGDDDSKMDWDGRNLPPNVTMFLNRLRDLTLA